MKKGLVASLFAISLISTIAFTANATSKSMGPKGTAKLTGTRGVGASAGTYCNQLVDLIAVNLESADGGETYDCNKNSRRVTVSLNNQKYKYYSQHRIEDDDYGDYYGTLSLEL